MRTATIPPPTPPPMAAESPVAPPPLAGASGGAGSEKGAFASVGAGPRAATKADTGLPSEVARACTTTASAAVLFAPASAAVMASTPACVGVLPRLAVTETDTPWLPGAPVSSRAPETRVTWPVAMSVMLTTLMEGAGTPNSAASCVVMALCTCGASTLAAVTVWPPAPPSVKLSARSTSATGVVLGVCVCEDVMEAVYEGVGVAERLGVLVVEGVGVVVGVAVSVVVVEGVGVVLGVGLAVGVSDVVEEGDGVAVTEIEGEAEGA